MDSSVPSIISQPWIQPQQSLRTSNIVITSFFPSELDFTGLPFYSTMFNIHALAGRFSNPRDIRWPRPNRRLSVQEHIPLARRMVELAQKTHRPIQAGKVPRWILRSVLYFLSLGSLSPASLVADCLMIIAIDLGCDVSTVTTSDERYVCTQLIYISF